MKPSLPLTSLILAALMLAGCAQTHDGHHGGDKRHHHAGKMDRAAMCEKYARMTPEERKAHIEAHHGTLSPEMLQRHEDRLRERCG